MMLTFEPKWDQFECALSALRELVSIDEGYGTLEQAEKRMIAEAQLMGMDPRDLAIRSQLELAISPSGAVHPFEPHWRTLITRTAKAMHFDQKRSTVFNWINTGAMRNLADRLRGGTFQWVADYAMSLIESAERNKLDRDSVLEAHGATFAVACLWCVLEDSDECLQENLELKAKLAAWESEPRVITELSVSELKSIVAEAVQSAKGPSASAGT